MPQRKLLLDTNAYLRLARSVHPLLFHEFGSDRTCLYVLDEFEQEVARSQRLRSKFAWVDEPEYRDNRRTQLQVGKKEQQQIETAVDFIGDQSGASTFGVSPVDVAVLGYAYVLQIGVVTDDMDMRSLGKMFDIEIMSTLSLLKLMLDAEHVDITKIRQIAAYWRHERDLPAQFTREYRRLFGNAPP